jgi:hypothetical protein
MADENIIGIDGRPSGPAAQGPPEREKRERTLRQKCGAVRAGKPWRLGCLIATSSASTH